MDFLKKHAMRGADLSQLHRRDVWSIPLSILREAVVNAVVHADYSQRGAPIRVSFFEEAQQLGLPEPQMVEIGMRVRFTVYLAQPLALDGTSSQPLSKTEPTEQVAEQVTEQVQRLLLCLQRQPLAVREIMQSLKLNHRPTLLYDYLKPAIEGGFVEMTQPDSPKSPTQKYRLTKKGIIGDSH